MPRSATLLVPGENIAIWPEVKLGRAYSHIMEVQSCIEEWEALRPLRTKTVQVSPTELWITLDVVVPPPTQVLATVMGDALHNLRSALDAVVWEMATFGDAAPSSEDAERAVQFQLYDDPAKFKKWHERVGSLSEVFIARLEAEQPYRRAAALAALGQEDTLVALHRLDVLDKHRNSIATQSSIQHVDGPGLGIRGDLTKLVFTPRERATLTTGSIIATVTSPEPFVLLESETATVSAHFEVPYLNGVTPMLDVLGIMAGKVRATLDGLYGRGEDMEGWTSAMTVEFEGTNVVSHEARLPPTA